MKWEEHDNRRREQVEPTQISKVPSMGSHPARADVSFTKNE